MATYTPEEIARRVRPAMTKLSVLYSRVTAHSSLTGPQLSVLSRLHAHGPMRISAIAKAEGIRMPTASNAIHQLHMRGLVDRIRDPEDGRGARVQLTADGLDEYSRVSKQRENNLARLLSLMDNDDLEKAADFIDVINRLAVAIDEPNAFSVDA